MKILIAAISLAALASRAAADVYRYEGSLESHAVSYTGESYTRDFDVAVEFFPKDEARGVAAVREQRVCPYSDELSGCRPSEYETYCGTDAGFELGTVRVSVTDRQSGEKASKDFPWRAQVFGVESKGAAACVPARLGGKPVSGEIRAEFALESVKAGSGRFLSVTVDPYVVGVSQDDMALSTTLIPAGGEAYRTGPWTVRSASKAWWSYIHEAHDALTWGTDGFLTLTKK
jgi:hypothetical protein